MPACAPCWIRPSAGAEFSKPRPVAAPRTRWASPPPAWTRSRPGADYHELRYASQRNVERYLDLLGSPTKQALADNLAGALYDGLFSPLERALDRIRDFFARLSVQPRITVGEDGRPQFEFLGSEREREADSLLSELLQLPGQITAAGHRVCVVFDEFQEIVPIDPHLAGRFRSAFQQQPEVAHVYLGSKRHLMGPLFLEQAGPLYRSAKPLPLGPIDPRLFIHFLRRRFSTGGVEVEEAPLEQILSLTGGLPYETQELCSYVWTEARLGGTAVDGALVERALETLIDAESARYTAVWDQLSGRQRALLLALADEPGRVYAEAYRRRHRLGSASTVQAALQALEKRDLVDSNAQDGQYVADVFLHLWLRRVG